MSFPISYWRLDPDYYGSRDPKRAGHLERIDVQRRINVRIDASAGDGSYSVIVTRKDCAT